jgi:hypothetical protein
VLAHLSGGREAGRLLDMAARPSLTAVGSLEWTLGGPPALLRNRLPLLHLLQLLQLERPAASRA